MRLPVDVRPNPYQPLANEQWANAARAQMVTPQQGFDPRGAVGRPAAVAHGALSADDIRYGQMPVQDGVWATNWSAAANAKAAEASQTLQLHGMLGVAYGRRSGTGMRELRVRRVPVSGLGSAYLPAGDLRPGAAHYNGLGSLEELGQQGYTLMNAETSCGTWDDPLLVGALGGYLVSLPSTMTAEQATSGMETVFGDINVLCGLGKTLVAATKADPEMFGKLVEDPAIKPYLTATGPFAFYQRAGALLLYVGCGKDIECTVRGIEAGQRMTEKGWWEKDKWRFRWQYLSGYTPWYKNPLYWGGGAVGGLLAYAVAKKKKWVR